MRMNDADAKINKHKEVIERMVLMKKDDQEYDKATIEDALEVTDAPDTTALTGIPAFQASLNVEKQEMRWMGDEVEYDSDVEPQISGDDDEALVELTELDPREKAISRVLRRNKPASVRFQGGAWTKNCYIMELNLCLVFASLCFHEEKQENCTLLSDLIRLVDEETIPYIKVVVTLPEINMKFPYRTARIANLLRRDVAPNYMVLYRQFGVLLPHLKLSAYPRVDTPVIVKRFVEMMNLPRRVANVVWGLQQQEKDKFKAYLDYRVKGKVTNPENQKRERVARRIRFTMAVDALAAGWVVFAVRLMLVLNNQYEYRASQVAEEHNIELKEGETPWFVWKDWLDDMYIGHTVHTIRWPSDFDTVRDVEYALGADHYNRLQFSRAKLANNLHTNQYGRKAYGRMTHDKVEKWMDVLEGFFERVYESQAVSEHQRPEGRHDEACVRFLGDPDETLKQLRPAGGVMWSEMPRLLTPAEANLQRFLPASERTLSFSEQALLNIAEFHTRVPADAIHRAVLDIQTIIYPKKQRRKAKK